MTKVQLTDAVDVSYQGLRGTETAAVPKAKENMAERDDTAVIYERSNTEAAVFSSAKAAAGASMSNQQVQSSLSALGFYNGPINGDLSTSLSKKAVKNFQRVYGLSANGSMNSSTLNRLKEINTMYNKVATSKELTALASSSKLNLDSSEKKNLARVWTFLRAGMGFTKNQCAGICGNLYEESHFATDNAQEIKKDGKNKYAKNHDSDYSFSVNDGIGYGLEQWTHFTVKKPLKETADEMGLAVSDINAQLGTIRKEVESTRINAWKKVLAKSSYNEVSDTFHDEIERPRIKEYAERRKSSKKIYDALKNY